ncbi:HD domain-containing protein [bacterium]|nr:HD domain-containing protein [bacterium]
MWDDIHLILTTDAIYDRFRAETQLTDNVLRFDGLEIAPRDSHRHFQRSVVAYLDEDYKRLVDWRDQAAKTIWFNPDYELAPWEEPVHDAELADILELERINQHLNHPTVAECVAWWDAWELPENIRRHVRQVAWGAYTLAVLLRRVGVQVNPILTHRGGLMHDLDKIKTLDKGHQHGRVGADFLEGEGFPSLASIVRGHNLDSILRPGAEARPWEINLVFFCDKLVEGDTFVTLDERFAALNQRYPSFMKLMAPSKARVMAMSDRICDYLSIPSHEQLVEMLIELRNQRY